MQHNKSVLALALLTSFPCWQNVQASEVDVVLKEMVITATKTEKIASEAPATVTVVTAKEIQDKSAQRIDEALIGAPGVFVRGLGGETPSNFMNQITLRGIPGQYRTGILVDGVSINNAFSGAVNMSAVPVDDIQQIEVVPGPFSSLYGGAGMSGVINIITKTPEKREFSIQGEGGSHNFKSVGFSYRDKLSDTLGVSLSYGRKESDGYVTDYVTKTPSGAPAGTIVNGWKKTATPTGGTTYIVGDKGREAWEQENYGAKLFVKLSPLSKLILDASYLTYGMKDGYGNNFLTAGGTPFTSGVATIDEKRTTASSPVRATDFLATTNGENLTRYAASYDTLLADVIKVKASLNYQKNQYWYTSIDSNVSNVSGSGKLSDLPARKIDGDIQFSFPVGERHYLVVGASTNDSVLHKKVYDLSNWREENERGAIGDWANGNAQLHAFYVQDEISVSDQLTLFAGARYDKWSTDGAYNIAGTVSTFDKRSSAAVSPKLAAVYKFDQGTVVKGAIGKAFRAPNLSDMYSGYKASSGTIVRPNPNLDPELVTTAEISAEHEFKTGTLLRATYYQSKMTDLIYSSTSSGFTDKYNAGKAEVEGFDLEVRQKLTKSLTVFANTTLVTTQITENSVKPASVGKEIPLQAQKMANLGVEGSYGAWSGSLIGSYVGKIYGSDDNSDKIDNVFGSYDPYFIVNTKISYKLDKQFTASLSVNNMFDHEYFQKSIADGRTVYLGLGFKY